MVVNASDPRPAMQQELIPGLAPAESGKETPVDEAVEVIEQDQLDTVVINWLPDWVRTPLDFLADYPMLMLLLLVSFGYLVGKFLQFLISQAAKRVTSKTATDYDDRLIAVARRPALTTPLVLSLLVVVALLPLEPGPHNLWVRVLTSMLLFSWLRAALKATHVLLELLASKKGEHEIIQARTIPLFEISFKLILVAFAGYVLLMIWGINPTAWLASAGVIGIAVGFAARDTLANLFSGIFIVADAPYKIGDFIVLDTGERGEVTGLGMRSTRLLTRDDIEVTIPNAIIANAKIINESGGPWEKHRIRMQVGVAYSSDLDQVVEVLMDVAREHPDLIDYPAPRVRCRTFGPSSVDFELMGWINKPAMRGRVRHEMLMNIHKRFRKDGIEIPFQQTDVWIRGGQEPPASD